MDRKDYKYIYNSLNKNGSDRNFSYPIYIRNKEVATQEWVGKVIEGNIGANYLTKTEARNTYQPKGSYVSLVDNLIPSQYLPSCVDDVLEYDSKDNFPSSPEKGKIYVDTSTNLTYRWSGTSYVEVGKSLGETSSTAYAGDKGKENRTRIEQLESSRVKKGGDTMTGSLTIQDGKSINVSQYNDAGGVSLMNNGGGTATQFGSSSRPARVFSSVQPEWYKNGASQGVLAIKSDIPTKTSWNYDDVYVKYSAAQSLTDAQKTQARNNIGAGTSNLTLAGNGSATTAAKSDHTHGNITKDGLLATADQVVVTDSNKKITSVAKGTAFNKNFGTAAGTVSEGNHTHDDVYVKGPSSATNNNIAIFDRETGKLIKTSTASIDNQTLNIHTKLSFRNDENPSIEMMSNGKNFYLQSFQGKIYLGSTLNTSTYWDADGVARFQAVPNVKGTNVSLEGHTHTKAEITDFPTIPTVHNATLTIQKNGSNVATFTANSSTNTTANITVPTKVSELTNDSGFIKNTGPSENGETKLYNRYAQKGYTGGGSTYWYYKIATLPQDNAGNYASLIITGRIGGWEAGNMSSVNALIFNRGGDGIVAIDLAKTSSASAYNLCDIVCYRESDNTTSVYLKCAGYFTFDINVESYQSGIVLPTSVSYIKSVTGTEKAKLSTTSSRLEVYNGNAYVGGTKLVKSNEALKNPNSFTLKLNGGTTEGANLFTYDGSTAKSANITASNIGAAASKHEHTKSEITDFPTIPTALPNPYSLIIGGKAYDGSSSKVVTAEDLGITSGDGGITSIYVIDLTSGTVLALDGGQVNVNGYVLTMVYSGMGLQDQTMTISLNQGATEALVAVVNNDTDEIMVESCYGSVYDFIPDTVSEWQNYHVEVFNLHDYSLLEHIGGMGGFQNIELMRSNFTQVCSIKLNEAGTQWIIY